MFYEKTLGYLGTAQTAGPLPAGASEQVAFKFVTDQKPSEIWAVVDEDDKMKGQLNECKEGAFFVLPIFCTAGRGALSIRSAVLTARRACMNTEWAI